MEPISLQQPYYQSTRDTQRNGHLKDVSCRIAQLFLRGLFFLAPVALKRHSYSKKNLLLIEWRITYILLECLLNNILNHINALSNWYRYKKSVWPSLETFLKYMSCSFPRPSQATRFCNVQERILIVRKTTVQKRNQSLENQFFMAAPFRLKGRPNRAFSFVIVDCC